MSNSVFMSNGRTTISASCSHAFKEWLRDYARRQGKTVSDAIIDELVRVKQFDDFEQATHQDAAAADWEAMAILSQTGKED